MINAHDYLFEIGFEEFPAKLLASTAIHIQNQLEILLKKEAFSFDQSKIFATPRRIAIHIENLSDQQPPKQIEKRGPAIQAAFDANQSPTPALLGFAKSIGVEVGALHKISTPKGEWLGYCSSEPGLPLTQMLPKLIEQTLSSIPAPKKMRWSNQKYLFIRPVKWLTSIYGSELLPLSLFGLTASCSTVGHRVHHPAPLNIDHPKNYAHILAKQGFVIADFQKRKSLILDKANSQIDLSCEKLIISESLLDEVTGLVEYPEALRCTFPSEFLQVPQEALVSTMETNQKYFPIYDHSNTLKAGFIVITNLQSAHPEAIISGNEKVVRPRLSDAQFFFEKDKEKDAVFFNAKLKSLIFQAKLGSVADKTERVAEIAQLIAQKTEPEHHELHQQAYRAAILSKADLATSMVGEFPEMQGVMGYYLAKHWGEQNSVATAMKEQYLPRFAEDALPETQLGSIVSLADKIDTLVGIFATGATPTGDKDPFGLRRAMLGVLRILLEKNYALDLKEIFHIAQKALLTKNPGSYAQNGGRTIHLKATDMGTESPKNPYTKESISSDDKALITFAIGRLPAVLQPYQIAPDTINAVIAVSPLVMPDILARCQTVQNFIISTEGETFIVTLKRIKNILAKTTDSDFTTIDTQLFEKEAEHQLYNTLQTIENHAHKALQEKNYSVVLNEASNMKIATDAFFDQVMVNSDIEKVRKNRLSLLRKIKNLFEQVADVSLIQNEKVKSSS